MLDCIWCLDDSAFEAESNVKLSAALQWGLLNAQYDTLEISRVVNIISSLPYQHITLIQKLAIQIRSIDIGLSQITS